MPTSTTRPTEFAECSPLHSVGKAVFCLMIIFVLVGSAPPAANEAHYLARAKHAWNPDWCRGDFFLESPEAHWGFVWASGWLTRYCTLTQVAWLGRLAAWSLIAAAWVRLSHRLQLRGAWPLLTLAISALLVNRGNLAGEWFLGGFEGKSLAYGFVMLGLSFAVEGQREIPAWLSLTAATWFHPVVGGWSLVAVALATIWRRREALLDRWKRHVFGLCVWCLGTLPVVFPLLLAERKTPASTERRAHQIHVYERLPHHLVPHTIAASKVWRFNTVVAAWLLAKAFAPRDPANRKLQSTAGAALGISAVGIVIDLLTRDHPAIGASLLRFYWFRLSDVLIPVGLAMGWCGFLRQLRRRSLGWSDGLLAITVFVTAGCVAAEFVAQRADRRPAADRQGSFGLGGTTLELQARYRDWLDICAWARSSTQPDALFLTPTRSQTFKWYAERPEYATWKDCPQDPAGVIEWQRRIRAAEDLRRHEFQERMSVTALRTFSRPEGIDYVVVLRASQHSETTDSPAYRNATFDVYRMQEPD